MASLEELEKKVQQLQSQLEAESGKTAAVEKEVEELAKEVASLKAATPGSNSASQSTKPASNEESKTNGKSTKEMVETPKEKKDEASEEDESSEEEVAPQTTADESYDPEKPIIKEGPLKKKGAIRHNWLERWFVLDAKNKYLTYYEKKGDTSPKGVIPLINAKCYAHVEKKGVVKPLFFNVRTETRDFLIKAETVEEKTEWVKAVKSQCVEGKLSAEGKKHLMKKASTFIGKTSEEDQKKN